MHIPDGYLSPQTCGVMYAASTPFWYMAGRKLKKTLTTKTVPLLSIFSAFSFVIMMFNVPVPGGTTAHAIGGTLMAVLLGPWAAVMGVSAALFIQAVFFGDGGILAFGANAFNMAVVLPFVGYGVYRLIAGRADKDSSRYWIGAAIGSYVGINAAALCAAIEFGIQPLLFNTANGTPLYCPYNLSQAIPAMLFAHLTVAGVVEALVTGGVLIFLKKSMPALLADLRGEVQA
ncbi:MAG: cobalt transporter CbiM [Deltaproteobacteria bacterium]|nr:cobalt transporter CbiM [Deltaproteobacteria bacterium]